VTGSGRPATGESPVIGERPPTGERPVVLVAEELHKQYGAVQALEGASIAIRGGEIHGLVGENGAGKSTLVRILAGIETADSGAVRTATGMTLPVISIVPQYPKMAPGISVLHNLIVGAEPRRSRYPVLRLFIDTAGAARRMGELARRFDIELDLQKPAGSLNGTELRLAALLAALMHGPDILILDEPAVGLAITDQQRVLATMKALRDEGIAILLISHDLHEVCDTADRVTVLIQGRTTGSYFPPPGAADLATELFDHHRLKASVAEGTGAAPPCPRTLPATSAFAFEEVSLYDRHSGRTVGPLTFSVAPGEIIAVTGVRESGLDLLEQYLNCEGELTSGAVRVGEHRIPARLTPEILRRQGIAYVPSDRFERAAALEGSVEENATIAGRMQIHPRGIRTPGEARQVTKRLLDRFNIRTSRHMPLGSLSGGSIQKLILARELDTSPEVCVIAEPTAGLDLQSQQVLMDSLREIAAAGAAVVILSSSVDAVTDLAGEVVVLHDGVMQGVFPADRHDRIARAFAGLDSAGESTNEYKGGVTAQGRGP
jgi:general nucleoside transport system ATP-binding protein